MAPRCINWKSSTAVTKCHKFVADTDGIDLDEEGNARELRQARCLHFRRAAPHNIQRDALFVLIERKQFL